MHTSQSIHAGVVGAGAISGRYIHTIQQKFPLIQIDRICATHPESARKKAAKFGLVPCTYEEMLQDGQIGLIINLTPACAHYDIIRRALMAGKHVYTEKTMTDDPAKARELVKLASDRHLYLGCAPDTFLGSALQTARKAIDDGLIGEVTSFCASANRNNDLLLSMFSFLRMPGGGVCYDYGVYYLTALVSLLGPVDRVAAAVRAPYPTHVNILPESAEYGQTMNTPNESQVSAVLQLESGVCGTLMLNADSVQNDQAKFMIYGTKGILFLQDPNQFGGDVLLLEEALELSKPPVLRKLPPANHYEEESRGIGAADLARSILSGQPPRASKELAAHVLDVLSGILESGTSGKFISIESTCDRPAPFYQLSK